MFEKIQSDLKEALKVRDETKVSTLRLLLGAIKNFEISKQGTSYRASDEEIVGVIQKQVKQRKEAIEAFKKGGRDEMAAKEEKELAILQQYLPEQLSEQETKELIDRKIRQLGASSPTDIGKVMGVLSQELKGKADLGKVGEIVRGKLSGSKLV